MCPCRTGEDLRGEEEVVNYRTSEASPKEVRDEHSSLRSSCPLVALHCSLTFT